MNAAQPYQTLHLNTCSRMSLWRHPGKPPWPNRFNTINIATSTLASMKYANWCQWYRDQWPRKKNNNMPTESWQSWINHILNCYDGTPTSLLIIPTNTSSIISAKNHQYRIAWQYQYFKQSKMICPNIYHHTSVFCVCHWWCTRKTFMMSWMSYCQYEFLYIKTYLFHEVF